MDNQQTKPFPTIGTPQVKERIVDVELETLGVTAQLRRRSNFSEFFKSSDEKFDKIARHHSQVFKAEVTELTVRLADQISRIWVGPAKENGIMPNRDDFVKLSVENATAFGELVTAISEPENFLEDDVDQAEREAVEDFPVGVVDTPVTS